MRRSSGWIVGILLTLALCFSLLVNFIFGISLIAQFIKEPLHYEKLFEEKWVQGDSHSKHKVAVIHLSGVISFQYPGSATDSMVRDVIEELRQAELDDSVAAVVLWIDSPGGEVTASDLLYRKVLELDKKKPVVTYMNSLAASGAFYTAMGSRYIVANELCITASIGVILQTINYEKLADWAGIQTLTFKSGAMKDLLNPARPMTEQEKAFVQNMIMETYGKFVGIVAARRKLDEQKLRDGVADGRVISGAKALEEGLVDATGYFEDAVDEACVLAKIDQNSAVIRYEAPFSFGRLFHMQDALPERELKIQIVPEAMKLESGKLYYISPHIYGR